MTEPLPWRGSLQDDRLQRAEQRVLERTRWSGSQAILLGTPAEGSLGKNLLREEDEGRSSLSLAKFRRDWTWECRPGQKSVLAHFFSELGAQQDPSPGRQQLAPAGRRDKARGSVFDGSQTRASHWESRELNTESLGAQFSTAALPHPTLRQVGTSAPLPATMASPASVTSDH